MNLIKKFIDISLSVFHFRKDWTQRLLGSLADAARSISYVETVNPSQADTLHREIKCSDERWLKRAFELCVREALRLLHINVVKVAIDVTEDPYWGDYGTPNTRSHVHEKSDEAWQWVNLSIVEPYFLPLMSLPYRQIDHLDDLVIELLEYLRSLLLHVKLVLFDRGFYHWNLIDFLNNRRGGHPLPYLIFVPKNEAIQRFIKQTQGTLAVFKHYGEYKKEKSTWRPETNIVILKGATKNKDGKPIDWCFATNQQASLTLVHEYMKRWNIETGFRIHDEAKIKTKSSHPLIRFFYHLMGFIFILIWRIKQKGLPKLSFKRTLKIIEFEFTEGGIPPPWMNWLWKTQ